MSETLFFRSVMERTFSERNLENNKGELPLHAGEALLMFRFALYSARMAGKAPDDLNENDLEALREQNEILEKRQATQIHVSDNAEEDIFVPKLGDAIGERNLAMYQDIMGQAVHYSKADKGHRRYVSLSGTEPEYSQTEEGVELDEEIDTWLQDICETTTDNEDLQECLRMYGYQFIDRLEETMNVQNIKRDLVRTEEKDHYKRAGYQAIELTQRFPLGRREARKLVEKEVDLPEFSPKVVAHELRDIYENYGLKDRKVAMTAAVALGTARGVIDGVSPIYFQQMMSSDSDRMNLAPLWQRYGLSMGSRGIETTVQALLEKVYSDLDGDMNQLAVEALLYGDLAPLQRFQFGDFDNAVQEGKEATGRIVAESVNRIFPAMMQLGTTAVALSYFSPAAGAVTGGLVGLTYAIAQKNNNVMYERFKDVIESRTEAANTRKSIHDGYEQIRTSRFVEDVGQRAARRLSSSDQKEHGAQSRKHIQQALANFPMLTGGTLAASATTLTGGSAPEALMSFFAFNLALQGFNEVTNSYMELMNMAQHREKFREFLEARDSLDLPGGEKEAHRLPVSELPDHTIDLRSISYMLDRSIGKVGPERNILKGVNLRIQEGEFVRLTGGSGSGKTTLLRIIAGAECPTDGVMQVGGVDVADIKRFGPDSKLSLMAYSGQKPIIINDWTLLENLFPGASRDQLPEEKIAQARDVLQDLGLEAQERHLDKKVPYLSGGQIKRVGLARALLGDANIKMLDEPTSELDSQSVEKVRETIKKYRHDHPDTTFISVMHDEGFLPDEREIRLQDINKRHR